MGICRIAINKFPIVLRMVISKNSLFLIITRVGLCGNEQDLTMKLNNVMQKRPFTGVLKNICSENFEIFPRETCGVA